MPRVATTVWTISPELVMALDERLGAPVDSYVNGSQTWLAPAPGLAEVTLELRLHPVAGYETPRGSTHYDVWESVVAALSAGASPFALPLGGETRPLTALWDGLECFAAYGDEIEPHALTTAATALVGLPPDRAGLVDHDAIGDAWERSRGRISIIALLLEQLT